MRSWRTLAVSVGVTALAAGLATPAMADGAVKEVQVRDECDQATFDAALFPGACDPKYGGDVTFDELIGELQNDPAGVLAKRDALGWKFNPDDTEVNAGDSLLLTSRGGELHTFTEVPAFGGGCVPELNHLLGLSMHPVCDQDSDGDTQPDWLTTFIGPGESKTLPHMSKGTHHFECLIHPWMRTTVTVR
jgi:plastocyanin